MGGCPCILIFNNLRLAPCKQHHHFNANYVARRAFGNAVTVGYQVKLTDTRIADCAVLKGAEGARDDLPVCVRFLLQAHTALEDIGEVNDAAAVGHGGLVAVE